MESAIGHAVARHHTRRCAVRCARLRWSPFSCTLASLGQPRLTRGVGSGFRYATAIGNTAIVLPAPYAHRSPMQQSQRIATWLVLVLCLLGLVGCGPIADRSIGLLYPPEAPPPAQPEIAPTSEISPMTRTSGGTPVATLTWPIPQPSGTPTVAPPPTSAPEPTDTAVPVVPEPTKEIAQQPPVDVLRRRCLHLQPNLPAPRARRNPQQPRPLRHNRRALTASCF